MQKHVHVTGTCNNCVVYGKNEWSIYYMYIEDLQLTSNL